MITDSGMRFSQLQLHRKKLRWTGFTLIAIAAFMLTSPAEAQQSVRVIQAPAPYNACNVRAQAGIQHSVVGTFRNGQSVTLLGQSGRGWYRVQVGQTIGWMARQCLGL